MNIQLKLRFLLWGFAAVVWLVLMVRTEAADSAVHSTYLPLVQRHRSSFSDYHVLLLSNQAGAMHLYTMRGDGQGLRRLSGLPAKAPQWSPDGGQVVFASPGEHGDNLFLVNLDGTDHAALTTLPGDEFNAAWSPDGQALLFMHDEPSGGAVDLYMLALNDATPRLIASNPALQNARWSPDGAHIAYTADETPADPDTFRYQVFVYDLAAAQSRQLTGGAEGYVLQSWVEKGKQLLISSDDAGDQRDLYIIRLDGSDIRLFSDHHGLETVHAISPDGEQVAYSINQPETDSAELYDQGIAAADHRVVSETFCQSSTCGLESVAFAPDGNQLLYVTWYAHSASYRPTRLWLVHPQHPAPDWEAALTDVYSPLWLNGDTLIVHRKSDPYDLFSLVPYLYDLKTGTETLLLPLSASQSTVYAVRYLPE